MLTVPRYVIYISIGLMVVVAAYAIYASRKMASNATRTKKMLEEGKISVALTPEEIREIAQSIKKSAN
jgi:Tfp pilus assembly protein PilO